MSLTEKDLRAAERAIVKKEKNQERALSAYRKAENGKAWARAGAYVIFHKTDSSRWGKLKIARPADGMGPLQVFVWGPDADEGLQYGRAAGCGYNKLSAALDGLTFGGIKLDDSKGWETQLRNAGFEVVQAL